MNIRFFSFGLLFLLLSLSPISGMTNKSSPESCKTVQNPLIVGICVKIKLYELREKIKNRTITGEERES